MDQEARNAAVVALAREADGIHTENRAGTDGVITRPSGSRTNRHPPGEDRLDGPFLDRDPARVRV
jgi:hypothetical protein